MRKFCQLYDQLLGTINLELKAEYIRTYLEEVEIIEQEWAIHFLRGNGIKRIFTTKQIVEIGLDQIDFSHAIFERCLDFSTDVVEAISLVLPVNKNLPESNLSYWVEYAERLKNHDETNRSKTLIQIWDQLGTDERYIFNKIITNTWRSPITTNELIQCLSKFFGISLHQLAYNFYLTDTNNRASITTLSHVHPDLPAELFPLEFVKPVALDSVNDLTQIEDYIVSPEWNGVRAQWVIGDNEMHIWTMRGELITRKFPEFQQYYKLMPIRTIIDGLIMAVSDEIILPKKVVRKRMMRKHITPKIINDIPVIFCCIDLLKINNKSVITESIEARRDRLIDLIKAIPKNNHLQLSDENRLGDKSTLDINWSEIKSVNSSAIILKHKTAPYSSSTQWLKLKSKPYVVKGVLLYARRGEGVRANQFTEYTLAAKAGSGLMPFTRIQHAFMDEDRLAITKFIKENTIERFGPVYSLNANLIFEVSFEAVQESKRHKCGFTLKNPLIIQWLKTETITDITSIEALADLI